MAKNTLFMQLILREVADVLKLSLGDTSRSTSMRIQAENACRSSRNWDKNMLKAYPTQKNVKLGSEALEKLTHENDVLASHDIERSVKAQQIVAKVSRWSQFGLPPKTHISDMRQAIVAMQMRHALEEEKVTGLKARRITLPYLLWLHWTNKQKIRTLVENKKFFFTAAEPCLWGLQRIDELR
ncbi:uncharacterized protein KY384_004717 [Bacidia gigantensis]|uniref:uncharacterized protein n=1 Tax=Bacidia gigantensis TaxID=2732470 RepID=UPI001D03A641|nr:uncharacterized protein KY384_004717 [Bacidia gigantensis]KAG8530217.1 hypothetical protein KY384_004717 [Bacidia gigantensis]